MKGGQLHSILGLLSGAQCRLRRGSRRATR
jgi:hypothetical protein